MSLRIANAAGFLGDWLAAPRRTVEGAEVDYLTLEYLAELTLSILARAREKDADRGYANDFVDVVADISPALRRQSQLKIVTNAGGVNPTACAAAVGGVLAAAGLADLPIGVVTGDDLIEHIDRLQSDGADFAHLDTGRPLAELKAEVVSANAYLGAAPIVEAISGDARIVVTGRVADAALTLGPAVHAHGWAWDDWDRLAGGSVAGHLIECGAQVTGGYATSWADVDLTDVGYPIALVEADGSSTITKPPGTGGAVTRRTVVEQLVYEIDDPAHYLTPDVDVDFTTVEAIDRGGDRVDVRGATGRPAPDAYKVSLAYRDGFTASAQLLVCGRDCVSKARAAAEMVWGRLRLAGIEVGRAHVELLGAGAGVPGLVDAAIDPPEVVVRLSVHDARRDAVTRFTREIAPLITSGPAGLAGYASGRSPVRAVYAYWPALVPKEMVEPRVEVRPAKEWAVGRE